MADSDPLIPARLEAQLRRGYSPPPLDEGVERAVQSASREHAAGRRRRRWVLVSAGPLAAAAGLALAVYLAQTGHTPGTVTAPGRVAAGDHDLNRDGRVDMLDVLLLARRAPGERADVNGDGVGDDRDVDAVAALAVRLDGGRS
jgi:hypothetical protein